MHLKRFPKFCKGVHLLCIFPLLPLLASPLPPNNYTVESAFDLPLIWVDAFADGQPITFSKGSPTDEPNRQSNENPHLVTLTKGFYLGQFEVTQAQYEAVLRNNPQGKDPRPSGFSANRNPVENLSWDDAVYFIQRLNELEREAKRLPPGWNYTLPTEAEWEFACRAGSTSAYSWGDEIERNQSNYFLNSDSKSGEVGLFEANSFGFHDMHGNVREWCANWYVADFNGSYADPQGPSFSKNTSGEYLDPLNFDSSKGMFRVVNPKKVCRGGSFFDQAEDLRSARRFAVQPTQKFTYIGFRLALKETNPTTRLAYALTGTESTSMASPKYCLETTWEDNGNDKSSVFSIGGGPLSSLLNNAFFQNSEDYNISFRPTHSPTFGSLIRDGKSVQGTGYTAHIANLDSGEEFLLDPAGGEVSTSELENFLKNHFPQFLGTASKNLSISSRYSIDNPNSGMATLKYNELRPNLSMFLEQGYAMGNGWKWAKWFGYYYANQYPWVYHKNLGWTFVAQSHSDNTWLFREHMGWAWTTAPEWWLENERPSSVSKSHSPTFPYLFRYGHDENDTKAWTYINPHLTETTLYDFDHQKWFELDRPYDIHVTVIPEGSGTASGTGQYHHWSKVPLFAAPNPNYNFLYWSVDQIPSPEAQFFATSDRSIQASFMPIIQPNQSGSSIAQQYKEILSYRDDLTDVEKQIALLELLFYGNSPTAGIN